MKLCIKHHPSSGAVVPNCVRNADDVTRHSRIDVLHTASKLNAFLASCTSAMASIKPPRVADGRKGHFGANSIFVYTEQEEHGNQ